MRFLKKLNAALALALALTLVAPAAAPVSAVAEAEAATIKINKTKKTLKIGQTYQLKITGTKKKVTWKSSKKAVAAVTSKGKVTAKAAGKANITAAVANKKFTCKITVKEDANPAVANAAFDAKEVKAEGFSFVVPKNWVSETSSQNGAYAFAAAPAKENLSHILVAISESGISESSYDILKEALTIQYSEEQIKTALINQGYENLTISNYKISDVDTQIGTAFCLYYEASATVQGAPLTLAERDYFIFVGDQLVLIQGIDIPAEGITGPTIMEAANYIAQSIIAK